MDVVDAEIHDLCCELSKAESKQILLATDEDEVDLRDQSEESDVGKGSGKNL